MLVLTSCNFLEFILKFYWSLLKHVVSGPKLHSRSVESWASELQAGPSWLTQSEAGWFCHQGPRLWNDPPDEIELTQSVTSFYPRTHFCRLAFTSHCYTDVFSFWLWQRKTLQSIPTGFSWNWLKIMCESCSRICQRHWRGLICYCSLLVWAAVFKVSCYV